MDLSHLHVPVKDAQHQDPVMTDDLRCLQTDFHEPQNSSGQPELHLSYIFHNVEFLPSFIGNNKNIHTGYMYDISNTCAVPPVVNASSPACQTTVAEVIDHICRNNFRTSAVKKMEILII